MFSFIKTITAFFFGTKTYKRLPLQVDGNLIGYVTVDENVNQSDYNGHNVKIVWVPNRIVNLVKDTK